MTRYLLRDEEWELDINQPLTGEHSTAFDDDRIAPREKPSLTLSLGHRPVLTVTRAERIDYRIDELSEALRDLNELPDLRRRLAELEAIVRSIASTPEDDLWVNDSPWVNESPHGPECRYCESSRGIAHTSRCEWVLASTWTASHPKETSE